MKVVNFDKQNGSVVSGSTMNNENTLSQKADFIYKQLKEEGCSVKDIIAVSNHLLSYLTNELKANQVNQTLAERSAPTM